jgi:hypothetical protein
MNFDFKLKRILNMNKQNQWLFEAPPVSLETEWELQNGRDSLLSEEEWDTRTSLAARRMISPPSFLPSRPRYRSQRSRLSPIGAFTTKRNMLQMPSQQEVLQEFVEPPRRYFFWDVSWLNPSTGQYEVLESQGPLYTIRDDGERIRSTLLLKWQSLRGGNILARCLVWNNEKWFLCKDYSF